MPRLVLDKPKLVLDEPTDKEVRLVPDEEPQETFKDSPLAQELKQAAMAGAVSPTAPFLHFAIGRGKLGAYEPIAEKPSFRKAGMVGLGATPEELKPLLREVPKEAKRAVLGYKAEPLTEILTKLLPILQKVKENELPFPVAGAVGSPLSTAESYAQAQLSPNISAPLMRLAEQLNYGKMRVPRKLRLEAPKKATVKDVGKPSISKSIKETIEIKPRIKKPKIKVVSEESYLAQKGAGRQGIGDPALHKNIGQGRQKKKLVERQAEKDRELLIKRGELRKEYKEKVERGEIRPPTTTERLLETAQGMPELEATKAARRLLEKKGINWGKEPAKPPKVEIKKPVSKPIKKKDDIHALKTGKIVVLSDKENLLKEIEQKIEVAENEYIPVKGRGKVHFKVDGGEVKIANTKEALQEFHKRVTKLKATTPKKGKATFPRKKSAPVGALKPLKSTGALKPLKSTTDFYAGIPVAPETKSFKIMDKLVKAGGKFDVELPFKKLNAPKTGLALKTFFSKVDVEQVKGKKIVDDLNKIKLPQKDYEALTFLAYQPTKFVKLSPDARKKMSPAYRKVREYFDESKEELKEAEIITEGFPQSLVRRLKEENIHLKNAIKKVHTKEYQALVKRGFIKKDPQERIKDLNDQIKDNIQTMQFIKKAKIQYVPLPLRLWFAETLNTNPLRVRRLINQYFKQRRTVDLQGLADFLLKEGVIKTSDTDIRKIVGAYAHQKGLKLAMAKHINAAKEEGLLKPHDIAPSDWVSLPSAIATGLKGYKGHPAYIEYLEWNFIRTKEGIQHIGRPLAYIKMMQFYNPLFLPAYDVYQAAWLGSVRSLKTPSNLTKAAKSVWTKDKDFIQAMENGAFSQPFVAPFDQHMKEVNKLIESDTLLKQVADKLKLKYAKDALDSVYKLSWSIAWGLDRWIRMTSYHHLISKGFTPQEAAQNAALFHGDYASLPPYTKGIMNKIFFTPTFKIVMTKAHFKMARALGEKILGRGGKNRNLLAQGFIALIALMYARKKFLEHYGFKEDSLGLRYIKEVKTDKGKKEMVLYTPTPDNILLRYWSKLKSIPDTEDNLQKVLKLIPFTPHPLYDWGIRVLANKKRNQEPVRNPFDNKLKQYKDLVVFTAKHLVRISELFEEPTADRKQAIDQFEKEIPFIGKFMKFFSFPYLRNPEARRISWKLSKLKTLFFGLVRQEKDKRGEFKNKKERLANFKKKSKELIAELKD